jgi:P2-related tail formation protein
MRREGTEQAIEEEDELEEVSDVVEDQSHVTTVSNWEIMHRNAHCRHQLVCIVTHRIMRQMECPTLLVKIQEKRNQNNQNVQWISAEAREDGQNINIVTRGGTKTGNDVV